MSAWESFRAWPLWLQAPVFAIAATSAVLVGFVLAESLFRAPEKRPVAEVQSPNTTDASTSTTTSSTTTTVPPTTTTTLPAPTTTRAIVVRLTNPIDVRVTCETVAYEVIGRGRLTDAEVAEAVGLYHQLERAAQQPGATVRAPTLELFCGSWLRERFPDELGFPDYSGVLDSIFGSPRGSIPPGGACHRERSIGRHEYQAPSVTGSCPTGWELLR